MPAHLTAIVAMTIARVVVVRDGTRTVLSVQSEGPWPLPAGVEMKDAKPVPAAVFDAIDHDAPRVTEKWEADPCPPVESMLEEQGEGWRIYNGGHETDFVGRYEPPIVPRRWAWVATTAPGFRVEYTEAALTVPVVAGQEVVIHVLAPTRFDAVGVPTTELPEKVWVPPADHGHFPDFYEGLFGLATARTPGVIVVESADVFRDYYAALPGLTVRQLVGADEKKALVSTRLHVRSLGPAIELRPGGSPATIQPAFESLLPWDAPVRCADPLRDDWQDTTTIPEAYAEGPAPETPLDGADVPELGLRRGAWGRLAPFDRGAVAGGVLGLAVAFVLVRRRDQGPS